MISGSIELELEITNRLGTLYIKHHDWLKSVAYNLSKNHEVSDDLVQELYVYLGEKKNPKLFFLDSFNLKYCHAFLSSRYLNLVKREGKNVYVERWRDTSEEEYNLEWDNELERFEEDVKRELQRLSTTSMWSSAKLFEMYQFSDKTMEELSDDIGISKSTTFLNVKKIKEHLKKTIKKPKNERNK